PAGAFRRTCSSIVEPLIVVAAGWGPIHFTNEVRQHLNVAFGQNWIELGGSVIGLLHRRCYHGFLGSYESKSV
ncbi:hypothetical protein AVEN_164252-1, partial [Araneus ventricosus]